MAAELITTYYINHADNLPQDEEQWREFATPDGRPYRVNLRTGAQEWTDETANPQIAHLQQLFTKYDTEGTGELSWESFWSVLLKELGVEMTDEEVGQWHTYADSDANGMIQWAEVRSENDKQLSTVHM